MTIGNQPTDNIDKAIDRGAVAGMFALRNVLELVDNRLNICSTPPYPELTLTLDAL